MTKKPKPQDRKGHTTYLTDGVRWWSFAKSQWPKFLRDPDVGDPPRPELYFERRLNMRPRAIVPDPSEPSGYRCLNPGHRVLHLDRMTPSSGCRNGRAYGGSVQALGMDSAGALPSYSALVMWLGCSRSASGCQRPHCVQ